MYSQKWGRAVSFLHFLEYLSRIFGTVSLQCTSPIPTVVCMYANSIQWAKHKHLFKNQKVLRIFLNKPNPYWDFGRYIQIVHCTVWYSVHSHNFSWDYAKQARVYRSIPSPMAKNENLFSFSRKCEISFFKYYAWKKTKFSRLRKFQSILDSKWFRAFKPVFRGKKFLKPIWWRTCWLTELLFARDAKNDVLVFYVCTIVAMQLLYYWNFWRTFTKSVKSQPLLWIIICTNVKFIQNFYIIMLYVYIQQYLQHIQYSKVDVRSQ